MTTISPKFVNIGNEFYNLNRLVKYYYDRETSQLVLVYVNETFRVDDPGHRLYEHLMNQTL